MDVGLIEGRGWAVVEANCAFGAGMYGCDPVRVLEVLARACVPRHELLGSDATWALPPVRLAYPGKCGFVCKGKVGDPARITRKRNSPPTGLHW
ncbi:DUF4343 domain-containing protein [Nocardia mangyaensis]|uniref:DUF4343 domain-containing protein n=1 Tax=Nocardia mangyaensis TaxID=2213200 RepID=UPI0012EC244F